VSQPKLAIIGGSGLSKLNELEARQQFVVRTPYGEPSSPLIAGKLNGVSVVFLPRHGQGHTIPPHKVNYRANVYALREAGVGRVIAVAAVGAITAGLNNGDLVVCDQIIDYTWGRESTYFDGSRYDAAGGQLGGSNRPDVKHIDFSEPYSVSLRAVVIETAHQLGLRCRQTGTYGATQGPRFETRAEIDRMERDGADVVGMTGMPEAVLAREIGLDYATVALVVNPAAGRGQQPLAIEAIHTVLEQGMVNVRALLKAAVVHPSLS